MMHVTRLRMNICNKELKSLGSMLCPFKMRRSPPFRHWDCYSVKTKNI